MLKGITARQAEIDSARVRDAHPCARPSALLALGERPVCMIMTRVLSAQKAHQTRTARATSQSAHKDMERAEVLDARWREAQKRAKVRERPTPPSHRQCHATVAGRV